MNATVASELEITTITTVLITLRTVKFCQLIATVLTLYDHFITFDQEIDLIWTRKLSLFSVLYLLTRYLADVLLILVLSSTWFFSLDTISARVSVSFSVSFGVAFLQLSYCRCDHIMKAQAWLTVVLILFMQGILLTRLEALYGRSRRIKLSLRCAFIVEAGLLLSILLVACLKMTAAKHPYALINVCAPINVPPWLFVWWFPILVYDIVLCGLALNIGYKHFREMRGVEKHTSGDGAGKRVSIGRIILMDSISYYVMMLSINIVNAVVWFAYRHRVGFTYGIPQTFTVAIVSIMGCRMVLDLRQAVYYPVGGSQVRQSAVEGMIDDIVVTMKEADNESEATGETESDGVENNLAIAPYISSRRT